MDPIKDAVQDIKKMISTADEKTQAAIAEQTAVIEKERKSFEKKVDDLNVELAKKDATLLDISNEVKELKAKGGRQKAIDEKKISLKEKLENAIEENRQQFLDIHSKDGGLINPIKLKDIQSSSLSSNFISYLNSREGLEPLGQTRFRSLVSLILTETDFVQFPVAADPVGTGSFGRQTELATKAQVDRSYTMTPLTLKPMAGYAVASRQSLRNILFLQSWLPTSMLEQLLDQEDLDFSASLVAAATGNSSVTYTVPVEKMIGYVRNLIQKKYNPTTIACDPAVWSDVLLTKPFDYSVPGTVTIDANGNTRVLGRPIVPVNWLTGRRTVVGDFSKAAIVQSEGLTMRQSDSHASIFTSNETAFLLERTEALAVFRPNAFVSAVL